MTARGSSRTLADATAPRAVGAQPGRPAPEELWRLDPAITFLNHGSFGACPIPVLEAQAAWRDRLERRPVRFLAHELEGELDVARRELARFVGADPEGLAFVRNATTGVATVLGSLRFAPGDELLATDHEYNATLNALRRAADRDGARVVIVPLPFPVAGQADLVQPILDAVTPRTRLVLLSHVTSPTALVLPIGSIVRELDRRGVDTLIDGAHAPGMVPLDLDALGAAYYTGNAHKWLCAPKGAAFLHVRGDRRDRVHPLVTSHGANDPRTDRSRYWLEFDWTGTDDPTPWLSIPSAIDTVGALHPDGWPGVMASNRVLALAGRDRLAAALAVPPPAPDAMIGAMAALPIPWLGGDDPSGIAGLEAHLAAARFEVPLVPWPVAAALVPGAPARAVLVRISAQVYDRIEDYERLAATLSDAAA